VEEGTERAGVEDAAQGVAKESLKKAGQTDKEGKRRT
jgi:hypothetical protein